jgi:hypothetical protein
VGGAVLVEFPGFVALAQIGDVVHGGQYRKMPGTGHVCHDNTPP